MSTKIIEAIVKPREPHFVGDGFRVHNFIPGAFSMKRLDPFIMMDYNAKHFFPPSDKPRGVGVHPHRGFETVSIAYKGKIAHQDSSGGGGIIAEGDVQWMTAASGVLHKEFHEKEYSKKGGYFHMVQLWVNLPAKYKMSKPKYQALANKDINKYQLENSAGEIEVIAGKYKNIKGSASTFSPIHLFNANLQKGAKADFSFPEHYTSALLVVEGNIKVNNKEIVPQDHFLLFKNEGETFEIEASENAIVLILSGEPLNEPMAAHGPFVMNTRQEIMQAFDDYNNGKFGYLRD